MSPFPMLTIRHAAAYEEISFSDAGSIMGAVYLGGQGPKPKGYNLTTLPDPFYCGRISDGQGWRILQPFNVGPGGEFREVVVYLEGVEQGKPFDGTSTPQVEAKDCLFLPFTMAVRDDQSVTVVNMDPVMHDIQAYETSHLGARVLFNVPLPMNPQHPRNFKDRSDAGMYHKHMAGPPMKELVKLSKGRRIFVMQSRAWKGPSLRWSIAWRARPVRTGAQAAGNRIHAPGNGAPLSPRESPVGRF